MSEPLRVVVDRARWLRGEGGKRSRLLRVPDGRMCCLGFACRATGMSEEEIRNICEPSGLRYRTLMDHPFPGVTVMYPDDEDLCHTNEKAEIGTLMVIDDYEGLGDDERERQIAVIGDRVGLAFEFVG